MRMTVGPQVVAVVIGGIAVGLLMFNVASSAGRILGWATAAVVVAALLEPVVTWLDRYMPRVAAILLSLLLLGMVASSVMGGIFADLGNQFDRLRNEAPRAAEELEESDRFGDAATDFRLEERVDDLLDRLRDPTSGLASEETAGSAGAFLVGAVLTAFLLSSGPRFAQTGLAQIRDPGRRQRIRDVTRLGFDRGRTYVLFAVGRATVVGFAAWALCYSEDVPAPIVLGVATAALSVVPGFGICVGGVFALLLEAGLGTQAGLVRLAIGFVALQVADGFFSRGVVVPRTLAVGPAPIVIAVIVGFEVYGIGGAVYGAILAIFGVAFLDAAGEIARDPSPDPEAPVTEEPAADAPVTERWGVVDPGETRAQRRLRRVATVSDALPVVNISPFLDPTSSASALDDTAAAIDRACREIGFFVVTGHGIEPTVRADLLGAARDFFALPVEDKDELAIGRSPCHRGYVGLATETLDDANTLAGDLKETLDTGEEHGPDHPEVVAGTPLFGPNQLPDLPGFRDTLERYRAQAIAAAEAIQRGLARALGLDEGFFAGLGDTLYHLRMIHYPAQTALPPADGQLGCGAHTDYGTVTLLTDDGIGGLQVMRRDGRWLDVSIPDGAVVVNIGDLMAIWTNDRWVSTPHRVVNPPDVDRYSMPLFVTPPFHAEISCLATCLAPGESPRYQSLVSGPYLLARFDQTHSYRNELLDEANRATTAAYR
jgi:isopenicillin N synthase-like dioxygenase/predicted PurR-regulated permease PerM